MLVAGFGKFPDDVALEGRGIHHVVVRAGGIEERKAVVVLGGDDDMAHAGGFEKFHPLLGVEFRGVELPHDLPAVFLVGDAEIHLDPLGVGFRSHAVLVFPGQRRIRTEVDECAELGITEPFVQPRLRFRRMLQRGRHEFVEVLVPFLSSLECECAEEGG